MKIFFPQKHKHKKWENVGYCYHVFVLIYDIYKHIVSPKSFSYNLKKYVCCKNNIYLKKKNREHEKALVPEGNVKASSFKQQCDQGGLDTYHSPEAGW